MGISPPVLRQRILFTAIFVALSVRAMHLLDPNCSCAVPSCKLTNNQICHGDSPSGHMFLCFCSLIVCSDALCSLLSHLCALVALVGILRVLCAESSRNDDPCGRAGSNYIVVYKRLERRNV